MPRQDVRSPPLARSAPWIAALLLPQLAAILWPRLDGALVYDRTAIASGEIWRLLSGHLVHWSPRHFAYDAAALVVLALLLAGRGGKLLGVTVVASSLAISGGVWLLRPDLDQYRGLSGIDSALFAAAAATLFLELRGARRILPLAALALFAAKLLREIATGHALFVPGAGTVVPEAHLIGGAVGLFTALPLIFGWRLRNVGVRETSRTPAAPRGPSGPSPPLAVRPRSASR